MPDKSTNKIIPLLYKLVMKRIFIVLMLLPLAAYCQKTDTTYVLPSVPSTDPHNVLLEVFSGQSCVNCPAGITILDSISSANPGRLNIVELYAYGPPQTVPPVGSSHDLRDSAATSISNLVYSSLSGLPSAGIDRTEGLQFLSPLPAITSEIATRILFPDSVNLSVSGYYDIAANKVTVSAIVTYTKTMSSTQNLSIVIVEDSIIDRQDTYSGTDTSYQFNNVFRGMITSAPYGDTILPGIVTKVPGRVYQCSYSFTPDPVWVMNHCRVIAYVNGSSIAVPVVQQCAQNDIHSHATAGVKFIKQGNFNIYPNPLRDMLNIESTISSDFKLLSITGEIIKSGVIKSGISRISIESIPSGIYMLKLINNDSETVFKLVKE